MKKLLQALDEFVFFHQDTLAQDPELAAMLRMLVARLEAKKSKEGTKQRLRVRFL